MHASETEFRPLPTSRSSVSERYLTMRSGEVEAWMAKSLVVDGLNIREILALYLRREDYAVIPVRKRRWNCTYAVGVRMNRMNVLSNVQGFRTILE